MARKIKYTKDESVEFSKLDSQKDGWFHVWENTDGIIETISGDLIKLGYKHFKFVNQPRCFNDPRDVNFNNKP